MKKKINRIYKSLFASFGRQYWWPADSAFEVMVGAILTQNTNWANVEKAIKNLKKHKALAAEKLRKISVGRLALLIRPAGYYNIKAARLKNFVRFLFQRYAGDIKKMRKAETGSLRQELLSVIGIGPETADSILLYALDKPVFVVDAYTKRILSRHKIVKSDAEYAQIQDLFMRNLEKDARLFNEYHALLVKLGKDHCLKNKQKCSTCPLSHDK
ncbi:MAG: endonuclease III domain-containing protein [Candidatus Omnitrophica bacterium]|nr:endonuclease III domain-containing protein [Candidatus Omnitrophota bacterium]